MCDQVPEIPNFLSKQHADVVTILDNDPPDEPQFSCGYDSNGNFTISRRGYVTETLPMTEFAVLRHFVKLLEDLP